jgi:nitrite reductase/ring-hydroxylating ferredoxin subunit
MKMFSRVIPRALHHFLKPRVAVPLITISTFSFYQAFAYKVKLETPPNTPQYYEVSIDDDLKEGEVREPQVGPSKDDVVLIIKFEDKYYCVQSSCPHAGLPLGKGALVGDKLICPFHNASFSVVSGYTEGGPSFDGLTHFSIEKHEDKLLIKVDKDRLNKSTSLPMAKRNPNDHRRFVIVGGGPAALSCAETLRQSGYEGGITIITDEDTTTYDRTLMSKWIFGSSIDKLLIRNEDFFKNNDIEFVKNTRITHVDYDHNELLTQDFHSIKYDKLLLATGGSPRRPNVSGHDLKNVLVLRNHHDQQKIQKALADGKVANIVVVGASFIGMETAAALKKELKEKINITVVDIVKTPFEKSLGSEVI